MKFLLNGNEVTPKNYEEIELVVDKTREGSVSSMNLTQLIFVNEAKKLIDEHLTNVGYFTGIPLDIKLDNNYTLNYYLDQSDNLKDQDHQFDIAVKRRYNNVQFWDKVDGATFDSLGDLWEQSVSQQKREIGRVVISTDDQLQLLSFGVTILDLAKQTIDLIYDIGNLQSAAAGVGTWIYAILMIAIYLVKLINVISQVVVFVKALENYMYPQIERLKVMSVKDIIETSLFYLGYTLNVNSFINQFEDVVYLGTANRTARINNTGFIYTTIDRKPVGYPSYIDFTDSSKYDYTLVGGFFRWFLDSFNGKVRVSGTTITFNRRDENAGTVNNITTGLTIQSTRVNEQTPNTNEAWQRCLVRFRLDPTDVYTSYIFDNSVAEWSTEVNNFYPTASDLKLIRGVKDVDMTFSQGFMYQSTPETFFNTIFKIKEKLTGALSSTLPPWVFGALNGVIPYKDVLATSQYTYDRPKLLRMIGGLKTQSITAVEVFDNYHDIDFLGNNSFMIHTGEILECNDDLFVDLDNNDYAEINGEICEVIRVSYSPFKHKATIIYKQPSNYASNLNLKRIG